MQLHRDTSPASTTEIYRKLVTNPYGVPCTCITESAWKFVHSLKHHFFHSPLSLIGRQVWNLPFLHSRRASYCLNREKVQVRKLAALVEECPKKMHACLQQHKHKHTKKRKPYICFQQETFVYARKEPCRRDSPGGTSWPCYWKNFPVPTFGNVTYKACEKCPVWVLLVTKAVAEQCRYVF